MEMPIIALLKAIKCITVKTFSLMFKHQRFLSVYRNNNMCIFNRKKKFKTRFLINLAA